LSYKALQLSPQASTRVIRMRTAIQDSWAAPVGSTEEIGISPSWLKDEADFEQCSERNSGVSGLALSIAFSASVWAGIALIVTTILR
jgi:hypothetical protein